MQESKPVDHQNNLEQQHASKEQSCRWGLQLKQEKHCEYFKKALGITELFQLRNFLIKHH